MSNQIRIVFIGDARCGKSSLIDSILYSTFETDCPPSIAEPMIQIGEKDPINIILNDTCSADEQNQAVVNLLSLANVIVYVIDSTDITKAKENSDKWIHLLNDSTYSCPVIVVGNKIDCVTEEELQKVREYFVELLSLSPKIEVCLECSAKTQQNIENIIQYSVKLIKYPLDPLLNRTTNELTVEVTRCLISIFRYFNTSRSRFWNADELSAFSMKCYGKPIQPEEMNDITDQLELQGFDCSNGISEDAFLELMHSYLLHDQQENVWTVLHEMKFDSLLTRPISTSKPENGMIYELSSNAEQFLISVFKSFDHNNQGYLTLSDIGEIFAAAIDYPWSVSTENGNIFLYPDYLTVNTIHHEVHIDVLSWLNEWRLLMRTDPLCAIEHLLELGWNEEEAGLFDCKMSKESEWSVHTKLTRKAIHAFVIGQSGVGKTALLNRFMNKPISYSYGENDVNTVMNMIVGDNGEMNNLILTEVPEKETLSFLEKYNEFCDMICCVFDVTEPSTFTWLKEIINHIENGKKVLLIGTKTDLLPIPFEESDIYNVVKICVELNSLEEPLITSYYSKDPLFSIIFKCSLYSEMCEKQYEEEETQSSIGWVIPVLSILGIIASGLFIWHHRKLYICLTNKIHFTLVAFLYSDSLDYPFEYQDNQD